MLRRHRRVVPLGEVAHQRVDVLRRMKGRHARRAIGGVHVVAADDDHRHAVAPGIVNAHRRMLQADGAVHQRHQRFAGNLEVAVCHADGGLFMHAGEEFGAFVLAVIDQRLVQGAEARSRIAGQIFDVERLDDVDHEVGAGFAAFVLELGRRAGFGGGDFGVRRQGRRARWRGGRLRRDRSVSAGCGRSRRAGDSHAGQEFTPVKFGVRFLARRIRILMSHAGLPSLPTLMPDFAEKDSEVRLVGAMLVHGTAGRYGVSS